MVEHFQKTIGIGFDAYNSGFQQVLSTNKGKFPATNLNILDTFFGVSFPQGGKVFGSYGGKFGRDLSEGGGFAYGR